MINWIKNLFQKVVSAPIYESLTVEDFINFAETKGGYYTYTDTKKCPMYQFMIHSGVKISTAGVRRVYFSNLKFIDYRADIESALGEVNYYALGGPLYTWEKLVDRLKKLPPGKIFEGGVLQ